MKKFVTIVLRGLVSLSIKPGDKTWSKEHARQLKREARRRRTASKCGKVMQIDVLLRDERESLVILTCASQVRLNSKISLVYS